MSMYFFYQTGGKESPWEIALSADRDRLVREVAPAFCTVLNLSGVPTDRDWGKTRYTGPFYADFDAEGDLELVCEKFAQFLIKLELEVGLDLAQVKLFASGGKGFHIEIPQECFIPKVVSTGVPWLPYIYREMAQELLVDTLDLNVYTGKRGRQWRTSGVRRENGNFKVPLTLDEAQGMTPELYLELVSAPREPDPPAPPTCHPRFSMMYERCREKMIGLMRNKAKRVKKANEILDPYRNAKKHMPSVLRLMDGVDVNPKAGFQALAMQLSIYAVSMEMPLEDFLARCAGLCEGHESDSYRYNTVAKRREELSRMWEYMSENALYDFEVDPIRRLLAPGTPAPDLGVVDLTDVERAPPPNKPIPQESGIGDSPFEEVEGEEPSVATPAKGEDPLLAVRGGLVHTKQGIYAKVGDNHVAICRGWVSDVLSLHDVENPDAPSSALELTMNQVGRAKTTLAVDMQDFTSAQKLSNRLAAAQLVFQGTDAHARGLADYLSDKVMQNDNKVFVFPREGLTVMTNPINRKAPKAIFYLTQEDFMCSVPEGHPDHFNLRYKADHAMSTYKVDIHHADPLNVSHIEGIHALLSFNKPEVVADIVGWFVAAHYRSFYHHSRGQFPLLQVYGEAGSGKTQIIEQVALLHWATVENRSITSATSLTPFALDSRVSSSSSAPLILEEYKPHELKQFKGRYEKLKDVLKNAFTMGEVGQRGTLNKGATNHLSVIRSVAAAPICFIGETAEMETAIMHRAVTVPLSPSFHNKERTGAFNLLKTSGEATSALGRVVMESAFYVNLDRMKEQLLDIESSLTATCPLNSKGDPAIASRMIFGRVVIIHALKTLRALLQIHFGTEFDSKMDALIACRSSYRDVDETARLSSQGRSEMVKTFNRLASLSRTQDRDYSLVPDKDYIVGDGWVEVKVALAYDKYRMYCSHVGDTPMYSSQESFMRGIFDFHPVLDRLCPDSELRRDGTDEEVYRLSAARLKDAGVSSFRSC